jgi:hypothetical protein
MTIIKYYTEFLGIVNPTYEKVKDPRKFGKIIEKDEAKKIIKANNLVIVHKNEFGTIWDTPDGEFYRKFKGVGNEIKDF